MLFSPIFWNSKGLENSYTKRFFFTENATAETHQSSGFPPYNVIRNEGKIYVELALAGYKRSNLEEADEGVEFFRKISGVTPLKGIGNGGLM